MDPGQHIMPDGAENENKNEGNEKLSAAELRRKQLEEYLQRKNGKQKSLKGKPASTASAVNKPPITESQLKEGEKEIVEPVPTVSPTVIPQTPATPAIPSGKEEKISELSKMSEFKTPRPLDDPFSSDTPLVKAAAQTVDGPIGPLHVEYSFLKF